MIFGAKWEETPNIKLKVVQDWIASFIKEMNQRCLQGQCLNHTSVQSQALLMQKLGIEEPYVVEKRPMIWAKFKDLFERIPETFEPL